VSEHFDRIDTKIQKREFVSHRGVYRGQELLVISSGIGTDNVEILLTELDALANIDLTGRQIKNKHKTLKIIRVGTSGALQEDVVLDSFLVSDYAIGLDTLMQFYDWEQTDEESAMAQNLAHALQLSFTPYCAQGSWLLKNKIGQGMLKGITVTCPGFYAPQGRKLRASIKFPSLAEILQNFQYNNFRITNFEMETAGYYALGRLLGHEVLSVNAIVAHRLQQTFSKDPAKVIDKLILHVLENI
jgi:uridine phosphorylase